MGPLVKPRHFFGLAVSILFGLGFARFLAAAEPPVAESKSLPPAPAGWKLVWNDEFDGPDIDKTKWDFDRGNGFQTPDSKQYVSGWGNDELEFYTNRPENAFIKDGMLHLRAIKESYKGFQYTSARLNSRKKEGGPLFNHALRPLRISSQVADRPGNLAGALDASADGEVWRLGRLRRDRHLGSQRPESHDGARHAAFRFALAREHVDHERICPAESRHDR